MHNSPLSARADDEGIRTVKCDEAVEGMGHSTCYEFYYYRELCEVQGRGLASFCRGNGSGNGSDYLLISSDKQMEDKEWVGSSWGRRYQKSRGR